VSQTTLVAMAIFAAFIVFVTARGELPKYLAILGA
jgi:hypothetical protein